MKLSPSTRRAELNQEVREFREKGMYLGVTGILDEVPVPPKRKLSPKPEKEVDNQVSDTSRENLSDEADLIQF